MNPIKKLYESFYTICSADEMIINIAGPYLSLVLSFWAVNCPLLLLDLTGKPKVLTKYKVQNQKKTDGGKLAETMKTVVYHNLLINMLVVIVAYWIQHKLNWTFKVHPYELPSVPMFVLEMVVFILCQEIFFYYSHRLIHHPSLYSLVHKKHHTWTAPVGVTAIYATTTEYIAGNVLPGLVGPWLMHSHVAMVMVWTAVAMYFTSMQHCGYHFPFLPSPQFHDYHHLTFNWNYGTIGLCDWLHGTDAQFQRSIQGKRNLYHRWPGHPMHELIPDGKLH